MLRVIAFPFHLAISRARWAAWLIYSPGLIGHLPQTPQRVAELSAFITLAGVL